MTQESLGKNSTDRGKKREQATSRCRRPWSSIINRRDRSKEACCCPNRCHLSRRNAPVVNICADKGYMGKRAEKIIKSCGFIP